MIRSPRSTRRPDALGNAALVSAAIAAAAVGTAARSPAAVAAAVSGGPVGMPSTIAAVSAAATLAPGAAIAAGPAQAPAAERFGGRLSRMPVDLATASMIRGGGAVTAELHERELTLHAEFGGLSGPVTAVHVHNAPRARPGAVAFPIDTGEPMGNAGEFTATVTLSDAQASELRAGRYYLQIHTETNPGGELRGWLLPAGAARD